MKQRALIFVILAGILWGTSGLFVKYIAPFGITSVQMTFVRASVSFVAIATFALVRDRGRFKISFKELVLFALIGLSLFGTSSCYYTSMQLTSVSTAVILMYTAPIIVSVFSAVFWKERFTKSKVLSLALMLIGCALVSGAAGGFALDPLGIFFGLLSGVSYAAYNILTKLAMKRHSHPVSTTAYGFLFASLIASAVCKPHLIVGEAVAHPYPLILLLIGLGIVTYVLPYLLYTLAMRALPAGTVSALGIVEPMAATLFGIALLGERLDLFSTIGIVLILLSVFLLGRSEGVEAENG